MRRGAANLDLRAVRIEGPIRIVVVTAATTIVVIIVVLRPAAASTRAFHVIPFIVRQSLCSTDPCAKGVGTRAVCCIVRFSRTFRRVRLVTA
jgi:hypothetical protein